MAMIDYGCLVIKNGVLINEDEFFQEMKDAVGWTDEDFTPEERSSNGGGVDGNFFGYIGDEHLTVCFYKCRCLFLIDKRAVFEYWGKQMYTFRGNGESVKDGKEFDKSLRLFVDGRYVHIKEVSEGHDNVFLFKMTYKGDSYRVIYGYGIDPKMKVWNEVKREYLPHCWKKVDNELLKVKTKAL